MSAMSKWKYLFNSLFRQKSVLSGKYEAFKGLLEHDAKALELIADLEDIFYGRRLADRCMTIELFRQLTIEVRSMIVRLQEMNPLHYRELESFFRTVEKSAFAAMQEDGRSSSPPYILPLSDAAENPRLAGGKATNLGRVFNLGGFNVPSGFVITSNAFHRFIEYNNLREEVDLRLARMEVGSRARLAELTLELQELILDGEFPPELAEELEMCVVQSFPAEGLLAVRSSALAEDSEISFAGQYASELNIRPEDIQDAYKRVLAGKYCPRAVSYRISNGLTDNDTAMAVLVIPMIDAESAGVIYSMDPDCMNRESVGIYCVRGPGCSLVDGSVVPAKVSLSREEVRPVQECDYDSSALPSEESLVELARYALHLEKHFGGPQDVEWAVDRDGIIHILQTRPLQRETSKAERPRGPIPAMPLMQGFERASSGAGCGEIYYARNGEEIARIPEGAVVVTPTLQPSLLTFSGNMNAVLSSSGSRASHFASVARELGIPVLVGDVMDRFNPGELVTVDGVEGTVYKGCVEEVLTRSFGSAEVSPRVLELYRNMIPATVRLGLTDVDGDNFNPRGCRSMHDFVRYCHEMSVREMFSLVDRRGLGMGASRKFETGLPLVIYLLDLNRGLVPESSAKKILQPADLQSRPMIHIWKGLSDKRVDWPEEMTHVDWEEFDRMSAGIFSRESKLLASYGLLAEDYVHLLIRFGYHLSEVDALCGDDAGQNYIRFRFKGGGAAMDNRLLRLEFIGRVLSHYGFETTRHGDLLDAFSSRMGREETGRQLILLGYLLAVTRLMDMRMESTERVEQEVTKFINEAEMIDGLSR